MGSSIKVKPAELKNVSSKVKEEVEEYRKNYNSLYTEIEKMARAWQGADNQAYTAQIKGFEQDFNNMAQLMDAYAEFLDKSSNAYTESQDAIKGATHGLGVQN